MVEGEITLPGGLREEARVLSAGGMAVVEGMESQQDRVVVTGRVIFHALYTQGDPDKLQSIEASADFTHTLDVPGAQPRMLCRGDATVEHVEATATNGRLSLRAVVQVRCRVLSAQPMTALTGLTGVDGLELLTQQLSLKRTVAQGENETLLREEFDLPEGLQVTETLYGTARPQITEVTGGLGRAGVSGTVALEVCHASATPGKPLCVTRHTMPFDLTVELTGEDGEQLEARAVVKDVAVVSQETAEGQRTLRGGGAARADRVGGSAGECDGAEGCVHHRGGRSAADLRARSLPHGEPFYYCCRKWEADADAARGQSGGADGAVWVCFAGADGSGTDWRAADGGRNAGGDAAVHDGRQRRAGGDLFRRSPSA